MVYDTSYTILYFPIINTMQSSPLLEHLIENLRCLPGVGPKSAQRMAYHLLQRNRSGGMNSGRYFVLMGHLSPLDGIGPREIGLDLLQKRLVEESFHEVILATNPTVEGDATANYIAEMCRQHNIKVSRIAHGIPVGGELETVDGTTLTHSFLGRRQID